MRGRKHLIEFVGPSGIGKTTFLKSLEPHLSSFWNVNYFYAPVESMPPCDWWLESFYRDILSKNILNLIKYQKLEVLPVLLSHYSNRIVRDVHFVTHKEMSEYHIIDEGIFHLFGSAILHALAEKPGFSSHFEVILRERTLVSLTRNRDSIIKNLLLRNCDFPGSTNDQIGEWGEVFVNEELDRYLKDQKAIIDEVTRHNGRIVYIDLDRDCLDNVRVLLNLMNDIAK